VIAADRVADWKALYWMNSLYGPVTYETRRGHTPIPDSSWTAWQPSPNDAPLGDPHTLYIQYRATLATADPLRTPQVHNTWIEYYESRFVTPLEAGWNLVSIPYKPAESDVRRALARLDGRYDLLYAWDAARQAWQKYDPAAPFGNSLAALDPARGFWIHMLEAYPLDVPGASPAATTIPLRPGWNLAGYPSLHGHALPGALSDNGAGSAWTRVLGYKASLPEPWRLFARVPGPDDNGLTALYPGEGYWILAGANANWRVEYGAADETPLPAEPVAGPPGPPLPPNLPCSLYGLVGLGGSLLPGATVTAWAGGVQVGQGAVTRWQGRPVYALELQAGAPGDLLSFKVNGMPATETIQWQRGTSRRLDLSGYTAWLPLVRR
jgi:hypothetical protein